MDIVLGQIVIVGRNRARFGRIEAIHTPEYLDESRASKHQDGTPRTKARKTIQVLTIGQVDPTAPIGWRLWGLAEIQLRAKKRTSFAPAQVIAAPAALVTLGRLLQGRPGREIIARGPAEVAATLDPADPQHTYTADLGRLRDRPVMNDPAPPIGEPTPVIEPTPATDPDVDLPFGRDRGQAINRLRNEGWSVERISERQRHLLRRIEQESASYQKPRPPRRWWWRRIRFRSPIARR